MSTPSQNPHVFRYRIPVRWGDLDAFNHVNNVSYLRYLEEARVQWLRTLSSDWDGETAAPVMASVQHNFRAPINWPAEVDVTQTVERMGTTSLTVGHRIESSDGTILHADGHVVLVWINRATGQPVTLPAVLRG